jgi:hypothetical protein
MGRIGELCNPLKDFLPKKSTEWMFVIPYLNCLIFRIHIVPTARLTKPIHSFKPLLHEDERILGNLQRKLLFEKKWEM